MSLYFQLVYQEKPAPRVRKCDVCDANLYNQDLSRKKRVDEINETDNNDGNISTKLDENVLNISFPVTKPS